MTRTGEFERISRIFAPLSADFPGAFQLTDDAAVFAPRAGCELVVTTDTMVAGVHFIGDEPPSAIAAKLLRVNLSDLASMGAAPLAYTLNIALPREIDDEWLEDFASGLVADQATYGIALAGGDSTGTPGPVTLTVTAFGEIEKGRALRRAGARPGDGIYVSGTIGDGALGLLALRGLLPGLAEAERRALVDRYRFPRPRLELGRRLVGLAHSAIDVSDGLAADLGHILETSCVGAEIESGLVPLSAAARHALRDDPGLLATVLGGGDDYELLFSAPAEIEDTVVALATAEVPVTRIGKIDTGSGLRILGGGGAPIHLAKSGWEHR